MAMCFGSLYKNLILHIENYKLFYTYMLIVIIPRLYSHG